ncbi:hypothetical protein ASPWEDRAFT_46974 [Aspergillus wentii DTO 134E9]|uniref:Zn(2)-C6 fungal-type domain-containing protein n=1 Tax=Aspergillus wentii DTO 134E9 TaxID=1073089 RepID=A0A1L9RYM6_ASPWE|nr:uncharacterized protein ASPWEDRAFT_46974 [Aspergillus wentii DTO 134E9]KAI9932448.1 hypothetical protein MW887_008689 [Aspergillus wentii]OJJ40015.1 hypothetical protein ASPWEDRAFT_46974 [Aspergillus wentii DTO 134E9]
MAQPGRRTHRKSRNGCHQCKARKIKCDESQPSCRNCVRHGVGCSFVTHPGPSSAHLHEQLASPHSSDTVSPLSIQHLLSHPEPAAVDDLAVSDLEMLHHYSTCTAYTFSRNPTLQTMWRVKVPQIGFSSTYALRAILAISALHLAYLRPDRKHVYVAQAEMHHEAALRMVTPNISKLMEEDGNALFLFSILTCFISCAKPRKLDDFLLMEGGQIAGWLVSFRGTKTIVDHAKDTLWAGPLAPIFTIRGRRSRIRSTRSIEGRRFMQDLEQLIREDVRDERDLHVYLHTIHEMSTCFPDDDAQDIQVFETDDVFSWLLQVSHEYLDFLKEQRPIALVIFGYFCVLLRQLEWTWWMQGWSTHLLSKIYEVLDQEHRYWLQWPLEQIGLAVEY